MVGETLIGQRAGMSPEGASLSDHAARAAVPDPEPNQVSFLAAKRAGLARELPELTCSPGPGRHQGARAGKGRVGSVGGGGGTSVVSPRPYGPGARKVGALSITAQIGSCAQYAWPRLILPLNTISHAGPLVCNSGSIPRRRTY